MSAENGKVTFLVRDNASAAPGKPKKQTEVTIDETEFVRRWALHILPKGFVRVRHYGHASPSNRKDYLKRCYQLHGIDPPQINDSSLEAAPESIVDSRLDEGFDEGLVDEEGDPIDVFAGVSLRCSECGRPMECVSFSYRPSWRDIMAGPDRPAWYES